MRIESEELHKVLSGILNKISFSQERAQLFARLITETSLDGVYSHGVNMFPYIIKMIEDGYIDIEAKPELVDSIRDIERWDGNLGPGVLNAYHCMERAISKAKDKGLACVALKNTNHWMRGGTYGWQAANSGCAAICFTNTAPNMPPWGSSEARVGNNPLVFAVPRPEGHIVLDMAMSLFSYGKLNSYRLAGKELPFPGGFDENEELTKDPAAILSSRNPLPAGYWKGSGLAIMLDLMAALLSSGASTSLLSELETEHGISQLFIAFDMSKNVNLKIVEETVNFIQTGNKEQNNQQEEHDDRQIYYPGERTLKRRRENQCKGIPVEEEIWNKILKIKQRIEN